MRGPRSAIDYRRLARRNLGSLLRYKFVHEYGYDKGPVVAAAIVADICATVRRYYARPGDLEPGEVIYPAPAATERAGRGKTMARTKLVPVRLTVVAEEDVEAIRAAVPGAGRREVRVRRLTHQAFAQGALLSQADLGLLMGCSPAAVSLTAVGLRARGEFLPLRGYVADMGSFPTHKAAVIRLHLSGLTTPDIAARTYHSKEAVDRYIRGFERVRLLAEKFAREELPLLTAMSERLVDQYLELIAEHWSRHEGGDPTCRPLFLDERLRGTRASPLPGLPAVGRQAPGSRIAGVRSGWRRSGAAVPLLYGSNEPIFDERLWGLSVSGVTSERLGRPTQCVSCASLEISYQKDRSLNRYTPESGCRPNPNLSRCSSQDVCNNPTVPPVA